VHYLKLSADDGNAVGEYGYGESLLSGNKIPLDSCGAAHYFKISADQGNAIG
jgi:TPR repeat protein